MASKVTPFPPRPPRGTSAAAEEVNRTRFVPAPGFQTEPGEEQQRCSFDVVAPVFRPKAGTVFGVADTSGYRIVVDFTEEAVAEDVVLAMTPHGELRLVRSGGDGSFIDLANGYPALDMKALGVVIEEHRYRTKPADTAA